MFQNERKTSENRIKISTILGILRQSIHFSSLVDLTNTNSDHILLDQNLNLNTSATSSESNTFSEEMESRKIKSKDNWFRKCFKFKEICTENQINISEYTTILGILRHSIKFSSMVKNTNSDHILLDQHMNLITSANSSESNTFSEVNAIRKNESDVADLENVSELKKYVPKTK
ncbi:hypothetical protein WA026_010085 [Henosepilachna vigintioctopunctata]|uniref:Uncharacterized protein n=1 Tax=Henosepilachna vigintioctopunctata TaxID=420089 RepID=A0AAW1UCD5_9CUCU